MNQNGKGDKPRAPTVTKKEYGKRWDKIFKKGKKKPLLRGLVSG